MSDFFILLKELCFWSYHKTSDEGQQTYCSTLCLKDLVYQYIWTNSNKESSLFSQATFLTKSY